MKSAPVRAGAEDEQQHAFSDTSVAWTVLRPPLNTVSTAADLDTLCAFDRLILELNPELEEFARLYVPGELRPDLPGSPTPVDKGRTKKLRRDIEVTLDELSAEGLDPLILVSRIDGDPAARFRKLIGMKRHQVPA